MIQAASLPVVAIGGINLANCYEVRKQGAAGMAVISALFGAPRHQKRSCRAAPSLGWDPMTGLREIGEFGLIRLLTDHNLPHPQVILGPGDDAAVLSIGDRWVLYTTDMLIEDVHFTLRTTTPYQLGQKALAVNLSDIAAMGASPPLPLSPWDCLQTPRPSSPRSFTGDGLHGPHPWGPGSGGDTVKSSSLIINVALLGETESGHAVLRNGARPGDVICVTNTLGDSAAGLALLSANMPGPTGKASSSPAPGEGRQAPRWLGHGHDRSIRWPRGGSGPHLRPKRRWGQD